MARRNHGKQPGRLEDWTYKTWQRLRDRCCCSMEPGEVGQKLCPMLFICRRRRTVWSTNLNQFVTPRKGYHRATRKTRKRKVLHSPRKQSRKNDAGNRKRHSVMAASSQRYHPGGDQVPFRMKRRRFNPLFSSACLVCLGDVDVLEETVGAERRKSEVHSGSIILSLSLLGSGSMHSDNVKISCLTIQSQTMRCKCEGILSFVISIKNTVI